MHEKWEWFRFWLWLWCHDICCHLTAGGPKRKLQRRHRSLKRQKIGILMTKTQPEENTNALANGSRTRSRKITPLVCHQSPSHRTFNSGRKVNILLVASWFEVCPDLRYPRVQVNLCMKIFFVWSWHCLLEFIEGKHVLVELGAVKGENNLIFTPFLGFSCLRSFSTALLLMHMARSLDLILSCGYTRCPSNCSSP